MDRRVFGQIGENAAADVLRAKGYRILRQNYRCRYGEIDIIAERGGDVSFVEVKTRQSFRFGRPCEAVTDEKKKHMRRKGQDSDTVRNQGISCYGGDGSAQRPAGFSHRGAGGHDHKGSEQADQAGDTELRMAFSRGEGDRESGARGEA